RPPGGGRRLAERRERAVGGLLEAARRARLVLDRRCLQRRRQLCRRRFRYRPVAPVWSASPAPPAARRTPPDRSGHLPVRPPVTRTTTFFLCPGSLAGVFFRLPPGRE